MAKILAIDYGKKRCGIAVTDELQIIASGLTTVESKDLISFLDDYFSKNEVETIVLGLPKRLNNEATHNTQPVLELRNRLRNKYSQKIELVDERFTSKMAVKSMIASGVKKKQRQDKSLIDEVSATLILQSYMDSQSAGGFNF